MATVTTAKLSDLLARVKNRKAQLEDQEELNRKLNEHWNRSEPELAALEALRADHSGELTEMASLDLGAFERAGANIEGIRESAAAILTDLSNGIETQQWVAKELQKKTGRAGHGEIVAKLESVAGLSDKLAGRIHELRNRFENLI
jgi:hypothetical protein